MKNNISFDIRKNDCSDIVELINLTKTYYETGDIINKEYLTWQYLLNPNGKPFLYISREKSTMELAGQYLVIPISFNCGSTSVMGSLSLNTITNPNYQKLGLFTKMAKATYQDCKNNNVFFVIGFPNSQSYPGFVRKLNFKHLGDIPLMVKPIKPHKIITSLFRKNKVKHGGEIRLKYLQYSNIKMFRFTDETIATSYTEFWNSIKNQYHISINKDFEYLKWRYFDIPTRKYIISYYRHNSAIQGIIILKAERIWGLNVGIIMDILILNNQKQIGKRLIKHSLKLFRKNNVDFVMILHNKTYEYKILKKTGFFQLPQKLLPQKFHFIVRINKNFNNDNALLKQENWKLSFGDYDVF